MTAVQGRWAEMNNRTVLIESTLQRPAEPKFRHLVKLWTFVFRSAPAMSVLFLGLMLLLSLLRPVAAVVWGQYIDAVAAYLPGGELIPMLGLVTLYYAIN